MMENYDTNFYIKQKLNSYLPEDEIDKIIKQFQESHNSTLISVRDFMTHEVYYKITEDADLNNISIGLFADLINNLDLTVLLFLHKTETGEIIIIPTSNLERAVMDIRLG